MILTINGKQAALKKGSSIEYVSENRIFTDADDYSMEIELPLADCPQNLDIFGMITRKDVDAGDIFFDAVLQDTNFFKRGAVVITGITQESVKVQFLEKRSYQNFFPRFDETYIDELDLGKWPTAAGPSQDPGKKCPTPLRRSSGAGRRTTPPCRGSTTPAATCRILCIGRRKNRFALSLCSGKIGCTLESYK